MITIQLVRELLAKKFQVLAWTTIKKIVCIHLRKQKII